MAYGAFGIFIPSDAEQTEISVLRGTILGRSTPTECNENDIALSPYAKIYSNINNSDTFGGITLECMAGYTVDKDNYPADRPQIANDIKDAINGAYMSIGIRADANSGCINNDKGNLLIQQIYGMYDDYLNRGSLVWSPSDPIIAGLVADNNYLGKSRPPVMDYFDSCAFYDSDGETLFATVYYPQIYSDDDFVYAIAVVVEFTAFINGTSVMLFVFDPYARKFIKKSIINSVRGEFVLNTANTSIFAAGSFIKMSPGICRVKCFMNKLVCSFVGVKSSARNILSLFIYQSYDNGLTWELVQEINNYGFYEYMMGYTLTDIRIRMASDGHDIVIMWGFLTSTINTGQIRLMSSSDGGKTWNYGTSNITASFMANNTDLNDIVDNPATRTKPYDINFDLFVDYEGRFVAAKAGEGQYAAEAVNTIDGNNALVFIIIEGSSVISSQCVKFAEMYPVQYEPWNVASPIRKTIGDITLIHDPVQREDYLITTVYQNFASYSGFLNTQYFNCIVRFKIMSSREWTVSPDWSSTGIAAYSPNGENIIFMEPLNRNTIWNASPLATGASSNHFSFMRGTSHRGHILITGITSSNVIFMGCFKAWTNLPINYPIRQTYYPATGAPATAAGMALATSGVGGLMTDTVVTASNVERFTIPAATVVTAGSFRRYTASYTPGSTTDLRGAMVGIQEFVIKIVVAKSNVPVAAGNLLIFESQTTYWDQSVSQWRCAIVDIYATSTLFRVTFDGGVTYIDIPATDDVYYEIAMIGYCGVKSLTVTRNGVVWYRKFNDIENSKIVQRWTYAGRQTSFTTAAFIVGLTATYYWMGIYSSNNFVPASDVAIYFKGIITSKSHSDLAPEICSARSTGGTSNWSLYISHLLSNNDVSGVLSSEYNWLFNDPSVAGNMQKSIRGEYLTPNPIWVGEEWLVSGVISNYAKRDALVWLNMDSFHSAIPPSTSVFFLNSGNLSLKYKNGCGGLNYNDFVADLAPTQLYPGGVKFAATSLTEFTLNDNLNLDNNITICFWMRRTDSANAGFILYKIDALTNGYAIRVNGPLNVMQFHVNGNIYNSAPVFTAGDINRWVFVVVTYCDGYIRWFKNGLETDYDVVGAPMVAPTNIKMCIGCDYSFNNYVGDLSKLGVFNRILTELEIAELYSEGPYGPYIPSDFFIRSFGSNGLFGDTWNVLPHNFGGDASNVLDNLLGSVYSSDRGDLASLHGGSASYQEGDVDIILYQQKDATNASYISANAVLIQNCNATDVAIYYQNTNPLMLLNGTLAASGIFRYSDEEYGIPEFLFNDASGAFSAPGVLQNLATAADWRANFYAGERVNIIYDPGILDWTSAFSINSIIGKCITNDERSMILDTNLLTLPYTAGQTYVYQIADSLLIVFPNTITARYWRFVFGNNAINGDKIKVGSIRLGTLFEFETNPDSPFSINRRIVENERKTNIGGISNTIPYLKKIKNDFDISLAMTDAVSEGSDFFKLINAFNFSIKNKEGVYLALSGNQSGFFNNTYNYFPLIFKCAVDGDLTVENTLMGNKTISIKLKEM